MKLDKAIEILNTIEYYQDDPNSVDIKDAIKLGIEALKRVKWHKEQHLEGYYEPLPGETHES